MSATLVVHCDRCQARVTQDRTSLKPVCGPMRLKPPVDLCPDCQAVLVDWLGTPPAPDLCNPFPTTRTPGHFPARATS